MTNYKLTQINLFPVKSLPGISINESKVEERGLANDRRWMLIDEKNMFITQRLLPELIFINLKIENGFLIFSHSRKSLDNLKLSLFDIPEETEDVKIWDDVCTARKYSNQINQWFSEAIDLNCKLVYMPNSTLRMTSTKYYPKSKTVSFADGYPFLIIGEESLNYLNSKLSKHIEMKNFRPNLVFSGGNPHDEDNWNNIKIGEIDFSVVKPCARCVITTIDLDANKNKEPLTTLNTYRNYNNKILFGQNALSHNNGIIKVGDSIIFE